MKTVLLFTVMILLLLSFALSGCNKNGALKPTALDSTVTTLTTGEYNYVTTDNNGELYALGYGGTTIFKYNGHSETAFYTSPQVTSGDTVSTSKLECLASDSLGNIYTVSVNGAGIANVLKISQSGVANIIFTDITPNNISPVQSVAFNNDSFYLSYGGGIYKISPGESPQFLVKTISSNFAVDRNGDVVYFTYNQSNNSGELSLNQVSSQGVQSVIVANLYNTLNSADFGVSLATDKLGNIYTYVTANTFSLLKTNSATKTTTVINGIIGNVDGSFKTAEIAGIIDMVADPSGNIYFAQGYATSPNAIRKITF